MNIVTNEANYIDKIAELEKELKQQKSINVALNELLKEVYTDRQKENNVEVDSIIASNPATIVKWTDGTITRCKIKKNSNDKYELYVGFAICAAKKLLGPTEFFNIVRKLDE